MGDLELTKKERSYAVRVTHGDYSARLFFGIFDQVVGPAHRAFGKVRVADLASVKA